MPYKGVTYRGSASGEIVESSFERDSLDATEVLIRITHSGLCGTDLHALHHDMVLGHEGIGIVEAVGSSVHKFAVGDRAGWGYVHETCGECVQCLTGREEFCEHRLQYFSHHHEQGSFGEIAIWKQDWLFKIPDALSSEHAAPLMCGGATVFTPLIEHTKPTDRVGIVGIGGLGHLAIQFASKMGCDVVVFSGSDSKREEAMAMGANEFYATKGVDDFSKLSLKPIDRLVVTTGALPDWDSYFKILAVNAKVIPLTVDLNSKMSFPYFELIARGYTVVGSLLAGRQMQNDMLAFAARNKVYPTIEKFPMTKDGVSEAVLRLQEGKMRYRGVLTH